MTTGALVDETLARFNRKSPQDAYKQVCEERGIHYQRDVFNLLPDVPSAWQRVLTLDLAETVLGPKGCMALLPCILVSTNLRKISLPNTGLTDPFVSEMCSLLQSHPSVRHINIRDNELVSIFSASPIITLIKVNSNVMSFEAGGTHLGENVCHIIASLAEKNHKLVSTYYEDKYFKLKNLFAYLDTNGKGWVQLKSLVLNCPYQVLQDQFMERIAKRKPKKRSDLRVQVNSFMSLVYMNYKTEEEITQYAARKIEDPYVFMVSNWFQILSAVETYNEENEEKVAIPSDLHRLRIKDLLLTNEEADQILFTAVMLQHSVNREKEGDNPRLSSDSNAPEEGRVELSVAMLLQASRKCLAFVRDRRPKQVFYEDRDLAHMSDAQRNRSRLLSLQSAGTGMTGRNSLCESLENSIRRQSTSGTSCTSGVATAPVDEKDLPHTWQLSPTMVSLVVDFYRTYLAKFDGKKSSSTLDKPVVKVLLQGSAGIPTQSFLDTVFESDFEYLKPSLLSNYYAYYSLPIQDSTITLQEMVNVLDELYTEVSVDKVLSLDSILALRNPLEMEEYAEFLGNHLVERDYN